MIKDDRVIEIARMNIEQNLSQEDISIKLGISRATVSRALKEARNRGYIRTIVVPPSSQADMLVEWIKRSYDLKYVAVTPAREDVDEAMDLIAQVAANYFEHNTFESTRIGVAGGRTVMSMVKRLRPANRSGSLILPIMGCWLEHSAISATEIAREIALRWNAQAEALFIPAFVPDEAARQGLLRVSSIAETLDKAKQLDFACIGVASVSADLKIGKKEYVSGSGRVSEIDLEQLLAHGAVGEICAQFFDEYGNTIEFWNQSKYIAVSLEDLRKVRDVLALGAEKEKARAFLGGCKLGIIKSLIVSESLAVEMYRLHNEKKGEEKNGITKYP